MYLEKFFKNDKEALGCANCRDNKPIDFQIQMAFQPIVHGETGEIYAFEALVRGKNGESAHEVISKLTPEQIYRFDQTCRVMAIETASSLGIDTLLSINFMPNAVYQPASCIRLTLAAANKCQLPTNQIIFELSETEKVASYTHLKNIVDEYTSHHFHVAIDDFGAGYSGLNLLVNFKPNIIKLDMELIRNIDSDAVRAAVVEGILKTCRLLSILVIAEGVETLAEFKALQLLGVTYFQGYLFAEPQIEQLPVINPALNLGAHSTI
jgi:EAL domain-containing protein (putative c-di-GMP-specific phosphodiesterase class I)